MRFKKLTTLLSAIFFIISIYGNEIYKLKINEQHTVEFIELDKDGIKELRNSKFQEINELNNGGKYFLDETPEFLLSFSNYFLSSKDIDSILINYNCSTISFKGVPEILIKGLPSGKQELKIFYKNSQNQLINNNKVVFPEVIDEKLENVIKIKFTTIQEAPIFRNDAIVLGLLLLLLAFIFYTSNLSKFQRFYKYIPALLLCYFLPAILNSLDIINGEYSNLYYISSRYLLPASLVLLCLSIDLKEILKLGPKALIMFFTGTIGIVIGGPLALMIIAALFPEWLGADASEVWRGLATVAGSWIGGGANQTAMKEIFETPNDLFSKMIVVDVLVANVWMAFLLYGAGINKRLNKKLKADSSAIENLKLKMQDFVSSISRIATTSDLIIIAGIGVAGAGLSHALSDVTAPFFDGMTDTLSQYGLTSLANGFFWIIVFATLIGVILSFTKLKNYEGAGASKMGSLFLYVLVAAIGTHMDLGAVADSPILFAIGGIWMTIHALLLIIVAKVIKAPFFFVAVGSQANVGGAASAPVVASAFHPSLAPVGVLLAVLGYAVGTGAAWLCAVLMQNVI